MRLVAALAFIAVPALADDPAPPAEAATTTTTTIAGPTKLVAVLDLKPTAGSEAAAAALTTMLVSEVAAVDGHKAISRNELKSILSHSADAQLAGCNEPRCAADVAHLVNADVLVTGTVDKVGGATVVSLSLIDAGSTDATTGPAILGRQEAAFRGADDQLLTLVRPLTQRLFDAPNASKHMGSLEVFSEDGVLVVVDGKEIGKTPVASLKDIPTGVHTVGFSKDGRVSQATDVVVARNEPTVVRVELVEESIFEQPWFWASAGGAVLVAGGLTTWAVLSTSQPGPSTLVLGKPAE